MSSKWIATFPGENYDQKRLAYIDWLTAQPRSIDGFTVLAPHPSWPLYPVGKLKPGECFIVPTGNPGSLKTTAGRFRGGDRTYRVQTLDTQRCACFCMS